LKSFVKLAVVHLQFEFIKTLACIPDEARTGRTGKRESAGQLQKFHGDLSDRMIVATAIENGATLMTAEEIILSWKPLHRKIDARL
jgi:predicted nucleic acid-binding protein